MVAIGHPDLALWGEKAGLLLPISRPWQQLCQIAG
jgi:hypothetical protein